MVSLSSNQKVAVVTGSSSGTGFETSLTLARNGFYIYATVRKYRLTSSSMSFIEGGTNWTYAIKLFSTIFGIGRHIMQSKKSF
jgi:hypothetical protein